jgi:hypothetical protein
MALGQVEFHTARNGRVYISVAPRPADAAD